MRPREEWEKGRSLAQQLDGSHCDLRVLLYSLVKSQRVFFSITC